MQNLETVHKNPLKQCIFKNSLSLSHFPSTNVLNQGISIKPIKPAVFAEKNE